MLLYASLVVKVLATYHIFNPLWEVLVGIFGSSVESAETLEASFLSVEASSALPHPLSDFAPEVGLFLRHYLDVVKDEASRGAISQVLCLFSLSLVFLPFNSSGKIMTHRACSCELYHNLL